MFFSKFGVFFFVMQQECKVILQRVDPAVHPEPDVYYKELFILQRQYATSETLLEILDERRRWLDERLRRSNEGT